MTIQMFETAQTVTKLSVDIFGSFAPNGSSDPASASNKGDVGWSVARAAAGVWTVTLDFPLSGFLSVVPSVQFDTDEADPHVVQVGDVSDANKTFQIVHLTTADSSTTDFAKADIAADAANRINFVARVCLDTFQGTGF